MADYADTSMALHGTTAVDFKFTNANEIVDGSTLTADAGTNAKTLIEGSTADNDVLNLTLTTAPTIGANFTMQNIETLNIAAQNTASMTVSLSGAKISGLKTISISGDPTAGVTLTDTAGFTAFGVTKIDASGLIGADAKFTVDANAATKGLSIIGGAAADKITGGSGADVLTGNGASDTFVVTNVTAGKIDKITDFEAGSDKIATGAKTKAAVKYTDKGEFAVSAYATLDDVLATFATGKANVTAEKEAYSFVYDNKTYVLIDNGTGGYDKDTDSVVEITGYTGTLTAADFLNDTL